MRLTPSSLDRAVLCAWAFRPEVQPPANESTADQAHGTAVHAAISAALSGGNPDLTDDEVCAAFLRWQSWWPDWDHAGGWRPEVRLAYDWRANTARELPPGEHRAYGDLAATEIPGTVDALRVEDDRVRVIDWKVGDDWQEYAEPVERNAQLAAYALAAARAFGRDAATVHLVRIGSEGVTVTSRDLDDVALESVADDLADLAARIPTAQPQPGPHCGRCPAAAICPEAERAIVALTAAPVRLEITSHVQAEALLVRAKLVETAAAQVSAAVRAFADANGGLHLANGKIWRRTERETVKLTAEVEDILRAAGLEGAIEQPPARTSKAAIDRAIKEHGGGRAEAKTLHDRLVKANAIQFAPAGYRETSK